MIYRKKTKNNFVILDKTVLYDDKLSLKAKGLHSYLMSLPDEWDIYARELVHRSLDGKLSIATAMKELEDAGYVYKYQVKAAWIYEVYENKQNDRANVIISKRICSKKNKQSNKPDFKTS